MTTRILLLRHGMTAAPEFFHGAESDVALGETGRAQAEAIASRLAVFSPVAVYSSAMRRARETAEPIARACGLPLQTIPELHERKIGPLSGTSWAESRPIYDATTERWMTGDLDATHEGGESYAEIRDRVLPAFLAIADRHEGETVVVVAHGVVIRVLLTSLIEGLGTDQIRAIPIEFASVKDLNRRAGRWTLADPN